MGGICPKIKGSPAGRGRSAPPTVMRPIGALVHKDWASLHRSAWGKARVEGIAEGVAEHVDRDQHANQGQAGQHVTHQMPAKIRS